MANRSNQDSEGIREPPKSFRATLRYLGPGLIISAALVGSGELVATTKLGAEVGFTLLWLIILGCGLKVFVQIEVARYAISAGETTLTAFNRVPGPRLRANWVVWLWFLAIAFTYAALGGIIGGVVQAIGLGFNVSPNVTAVFMVLFTVALLVLGKYRGIESAAMLLVVCFTLVTLGTVVAIQATPFSFSMDQVMDGLKFRLPANEAAIATALGAFGLIGVTGAEVVSYPYWCVEKGYARFTGKPSADAAWLVRAQGWVRVMRTDAFLALGIYTTSTVAFYLIGAAVLNPQQLNPDGLALVSTLVEAYAPVFGEYARWLLVVGAVAVLYSTYLVAMGSSARTLTDFATILGWVDRENPASMQRSVSRLSVVLPLITLGIFLSGMNPVGLIIIGGIGQALFLPVASLCILYLRYRVTDPRLRPGRLWDIALLISCASLVTVGLVGLIRLLTR